MCRVGEVADARAARATSSTSARSAAARPRRPAPGGARHQHALDDRHREVPVDRLELRHVADARARRARTHRRRAAARIVPEQHAQQRGLARAGRADDAGELHRVDGEVDVGEDGVAAVADTRRRARSSSERAQRPASVIAGTPPCRVRRRTTSRASSAAASPPSALDHRDVVEPHQAEPRVLRIARARRAGRRRAARRRTSRRPRWPICSSTGLGEDLRAEDRRHLLGLDLVDQVGDLLGRRVLEVARLDRADDRPAVASARSRRRRRGR